MNYLTLRYYEDYRKDNPLIKDEKMHRYSELKQQYISYKQDIKPKKRVFKSWTLYDTILKGQALSARKVHG